MSQYILVMIWLAIVYFTSQTMNVYTDECVLGKNKRCVTVGFALLAVIPLIWWTATRPQWFIDTGAYASAFKAMPNTFGEMGSYLATVDKDQGFSVLGFLIKMLISDDVKVYFGVLATIQMVSLAIVFRKFSTNYIMALFLFIATTDYLSWMHNGIRQFTAVALIFAATELMLKKKYVPLICVILLASTIHGSALVMIPIVFIVQGKPWNKRTLLAILIFVIAITYVDIFTDVLDVLLEDTQYTNVVDDWESGGDDGTNPLRVLVYSVPTILSIIGYRYIKEENDPIINFACNMGILSTLLYCLSMVTSGIFIGRLPIYCSLYAIGILLPWELDNMFTKESSKIMKLGMIVCFLGFYYYQVHFIWNLV